MGVYIFLIVWFAIAIVIAVADVIMDLKKGSTYTIGDVAFILWIILTGPFILIWSDNVANITILNLKNYKK